VSKNAIRYCFEQDDDCHWYLIKAEDAEAFNKWIASFDDKHVNGDPTLRSFDEFRCDSPFSYTFENPKEDE
jgi:hypothetical protein